MKRPLRLLVIGGVAAGTKGAAKARRDDPSMDITIITDEPFISYAGCGLAYYIGNVIENREKLFARSPQEFKEKQNITVLTNYHADRINTYDQVVRVTDLQSGNIINMPYDKLLIATGASAVFPPLEGVDCTGVFPLHSITDADAVKSFLAGRNIRNACIIGGGFIGIEMAENFLTLGIKPTLFEMADHLMSRLLDMDISTIVSKHMEEKGVSIHTGAIVEKILGDTDNSVKGLHANGQEYEFDIVVLAAGVRPNVQLARNARIKLGETGAIRVDNRMETSVKNIFAAGDCAETTNLVSGKPCWIPLGSTANKQGRVAGAAIAGGGKSFPGVLGTTIVKACDLSVGRTGLNESEAKTDGFNPISVTVTTPVRAGYYPGGGKVTLKLTADRGSQKVLGAQAVGDSTVDKIIDTIAAALTGKLSIQELTNVDLCYSPPYSAALGTVIVAAGVLEEKI